MQEHNRRIAKNLRQWNSRPSSLSNLSSLPRSAWRLRTPRMINKAGCQGRPRSQDGLKRSRSSSSIDREVVMHDSVPTCGDAVQGIDPQSTKRPLKEPPVWIAQSTKDEVLSPEQPCTEIVGKERRPQTKSNLSRNRQRRSSADSLRE